MPLTTRLSNDVGEPSSATYEPVALWVKLPATLIVPALAPGLSRPAFVRLPRILPLPVRRAPAAMAAVLRLPPLSTMAPCVMAVVPVYVVSAATRSSPVPVFVRLPVPLIAPWVTRILAPVSIVPPPDSSARLRARVKPAAARSVPPFKVTPPDEAPRLVLSDTSSTPTLTVVPPE